MNKKPTDDLSYRLPMGISIKMLNGFYPSSRDKTEDCLSFLLEDLGKGIVLNKVKVKTKVFLTCPVKMY